MNFEALKNGIVKSKTFPLTPIIKEAFNLEIEAFKLDRLDRNTVNISDLNDNVLYQLFYKEAEKELEIISVANIEDKITLKGISIGEIVTPRIEDIHDAIISNYELLLANIVFNISMDDIDRSDLLLLKSDSRFNLKLSETNSRFLKRCELFAE